MTNLKTILFVCIFSFIGFNACNESSSSQTEQKGKEYTSAYICPMHCKSSGSEEMGICPVCEMDYVANKNQKK